MDRIPRTITRSENLYPNQPSLDNRITKLNAPAASAQDYSREVSEILANNNDWLLSEINAKQAQIKHIDEQLERIEIRLSCIEVYLDNSPEVIDLRGKLEKLDNNRIDHEKRLRNLEDLQNNSNRLSTSVEQLTSFEERLNNLERESALTRNFNLLASVRKSKEKLGRTCKFLALFTSPSKYDRESLIIAFKQIEQLKNNVKRFEEALQKSNQVISSLNSDLLKQTGIKKYIGPVSVSEISDLIPAVASTSRDVKRRPISKDLPRLPSQTSTRAISPYSELPSVIGSSRSIRGTRGSEYSLPSIQIQPATAVPAPNGYPTSVRSRKSSVSTIRPSLIARSDHSSVVDPMLRINNRSNSSVYPSSGSHYQRSLPSLSSEQTIFRGSQAELSSQYSQLTMQDITPPSWNYYR